MSSRPSQPSTTSQIPSKSTFYQQREALVGEIAVSLEHVLQNINKLNRSLEGVIAVGNEFGAVEALWSQFEGVMAQDEEGGKEGEGKEGVEDEEGEGADTRCGENEKG
ncbi:Dolichyl-diphosphooligosaccharide-protein glycosyltransferase subunit dad1 [Lecanora helva]